MTPPRRRMAHHQKQALVSFLKFYEIPNTLRDYKVRVTRTRRKETLSWSDAQKIILYVDEPKYKAIYQFMLFTGLGQDEFCEINQSPEIRQEIEKQKSEPTTIIHLQPRKANIDDFFVIAPTDKIPSLPVCTAVWRKELHQEQ